MKATAESKATLVLLSFPVLQAKLGALIWR